jgi:hemerythrin-like metal-binding protein
MYPSRAGVSVNQQLAMYQFKGSKLCEIGDREHMQIKREHQELHKAIRDGADAERILEISTDLILTTLLHFESEERTMGTSSNSTLAAHRQLHAEIIESLNAISSDLEHRNIEAAMELLKLFDGRLTYHLEVEDAEMERILAN